MTLLLLGGSTVPTIAIDASSPAIFGAFAATATSASFTPPASSLLVALVTGTASSPVVTGSNGNTWRKILDFNNFTTNWASIWVCDVSTSVAQTVTITATGGNVASQVMVVTGAVNAASQTGASATTTGSGVTLTPTVLASLLVASNNDGVGSHTPIAGTTMQSNDISTGWVGAEFGYKTALTAVLTSTNYGFVATGRQEVGVEILPTGAGGPKPMAIASVAQATVTMGLGVARKLTAAAVGTSTATMGMGVARKLTAAAVGTSVDTFALVEARRLTAVVHGVATGTVGLTIARRMLFAAIGVATTTTVPTVVRPLALTSVGVATDVTVFVVARKLAMHPSGRPKGSFPFTLPSWSFTGQWHLPITAMAGRSITTVDMPASWGISASAPAQISSNMGGSGVYTTASFTPPSGALLVAILADNSNYGQALPALMQNTYTITDSSGLTWYKRVSDAIVSKAIWVADSPGVAMTVSVTSNNVLNSVGARTFFQVMVLTTPHVAAASQAGTTVMEAAGNSNHVPQVNLTPTSQGSMVLAVLTNPESQFWANLSGTGTFFSEHVGPYTTTMYADGTSQQSGIMVFRLTRPTTLAAVTVGTSYDNLALEPLFNTPNGALAYSDVVAAEIQFNQGLLFTVAATKFLAMSPAGHSTAVAALVVARNLTATAAGNGQGGTANMRVARGLTMAASGLGVGIANVRVARGLTVVAHGVGTTVAVARETLKFNTSAVGVATVVVSFRITRPITMTPAALAVMSSTLAIARRLVLVGGGISTSTASFVVARRLTGTANGVASTVVASRVARALTINPHGVATTVVAMAAARKLVIAPVGQSTAVMLLGIPKLMVAAVHGVATTATSFTVARKLIMSSVGVGTGAGTFRVARALLLPAIGTGTTALTVKVARRMTVIAAGIAVTTTTSRVAWRLTATTAGSSTTVITARVAWKLNATATAVAAVVVTFKVTRSMVTAAAGLAVMSVTFAVARRMVLSPAGRAACTLSMNDVRRLIALVHGVATTVAVGTFARRLIVTSVGRATVVGAMLEQRAFAFAVGSPLITDNFNRADGGIGANWTNDIGTYTVVSNQAKAATGVTPIALYTASVPSKDQFAQVTYASTSASTGVVLRSALGQNGYIGRLSTNNTAGIFRQSVGVVTQLASVAYTPIIGDVMRLEVRGSTLTFYVNGVSMTSVTNALFTSGFIGLRAGTNALFDDFSGGGLGAAATVTMGLSRTVSGAIAAMGTSTALAASGVARALSFTVVSSSIATAALGRAFPLAAGSVGSATTATTLQALATMTSTAVGQGAVTATTMIGRQFVLVAAGQGTTNATFGVARVFASTADGVSVIGVALATAQPVAIATHGTATAAVTTRMIRGLAVFTHGVSTSTAALTVAASVVPLAATSTGIARATTVLSGGIAPTTSVLDIMGTGVMGAVGHGPDLFIAVARVVDLAMASGGRASSSVTQRVTRGLKTISVGTAAIVASIRRGFTLAASVVGHATSILTLVRFEKLGFTAFAGAVCTYSFKISRGLTMRANGTDMFQITFAVPIRFVSAAAATVASSLNAVRRLILLTTGGTSTAFINLGTSRRMAGAAAGKATTTTALTRQITISGLAVGRAATAITITKRVPAVATATGTSTAVVASVLRRSLILLSVGGRGTATLQGVVFHATQAASHGQATATAMSARAAAVAWRASGATTAVSRMTDLNALRLLIVATTNATATTGLGRSMVGAAAGGSIVMTTLADLRSALFNSYGHAYNAATFPFERTYQVWPRGLIVPPTMAVRTGQIWPR